MSTRFVLVTAIWSYQGLTDFLMSHGLRHTTLLTHFVDLSLMVRRDKIKITGDRLKPLAYLSLLVSIISLIYSQERQNLRHSMRRARALSSSSSINLVLAFMVYPISSTFCLHKGRCTFMYSARSFSIGRCERNDSWPLSQCPTRGA